MIKETTKAAKSCRKHNTTLSHAAVLARACSWVRQFLPLHAEGYACTTEQLEDVLLAVCCQNETREQLESQGWDGNFARHFQPTIASGEAVGLGLTHHLFPLESASSLFHQQVTPVKRERFSEILHKFILDESS